MVLHEFPSGRWLAPLLALLFAGCGAPPPPKPEEPATDEVRLHEQLVERRTESLRTARGAAERTDAEIESLKVELAEERDPDRQGELAVRLESRRLRRLELLVLVERHDLKKLELEEELTALRLEQTRGAPPSDREKQERRQAAFARRIERTSRLITTLRDAAAAATSDRERRRIQTSLELEQQLLAELERQAAEKK